MALNKYRFNPGDKLPAENINSIDPDNIIPQAAGYLTGGTGHSDLSVFQALGAGANDGKFKMNIDGNVYDNVSVNFVSNKIESLTYAQAKNNIGSYCIRFSADGTKLLIKSESTWSLTTYNLSTPWDISTLTSWKTQSFDTVSGYPTEFEISPDGTMLFCISPTNSSDEMFLRKATLSTPWDITTPGTWSSVATGQGGNPHNGLRLSDDGTRVYICHYNTFAPYTARIRVYRLSTPWDISTLVSHNTVELPSVFNQSDIRLSFNNNGKLLTIQKYHSRVVQRYTLPTPYEISLTNNLFSDSLIQSGYANTGDKVGIIIHENRLFTVGRYNNNGYLEEHIFGSVHDMEDLLYSLQDSVRQKTSSTETVEYDTDHFIITSATKNRKSQVLKLMTPSTGTDISGAGATPYLDMADNATETQGTGEEYRLVRLDEDGMLPKEIVQVDSGDNYVANPIALNTVYQNKLAYPIVVSLTARMSVGSGGTDTGVVAKIGTTSSPANVVGQSLTVANSYGDSRGYPIVIIVPAGQYYKFETYGNGRVDLISSCYYQLL